MMPSQDRFKQTVIATLAKRAAYQCSNPDCNALTAGPSENRASSVNIGEAAHIYGANPGSARYNEAMASADRSDITNAIWICGNCHKLIDDDPERYPSGLLFEWQRSHEQRIGELVGKAGTDARRRYENRHIEDLGRLSYLAERIILQKPDFWEYRLTTEMLRFEMAPILRRWRALKSGLYIKPSERIQKMDAIPWILNRLAEIQRIMHAFTELMNIEFHRAWGELGVPGDDEDIVCSCRLFAEMCESAIVWEEAVRFVTIEEIFKDVRDLFMGIAGEVIEEAAKLPKFLSDNIGDNPVPGEHRLMLTLTVPEGWNDAVEAALARATDTILSEMQS